MTAGQLRDVLNEHFKKNPDDENLEMATSSDPEGNGFHKLPPLEKFEEHGMSVDAGHLVLWAWSGVEL